jgi:hypothetical protein
MQNHVHDRYHIGEGFLTAFFLALNPPILRGCALGIKLISGNRRLHIISPRTLRPGRRRFAQSTRGLSQSKRSRRKRSWLALILAKAASDGALCHRTFHPRGVDEADGTVFYRALRCCQRRRANDLIRADDGDQMQVPSRIIPDDWSLID